MDDTRYLSPNNPDPNTGHLGDPNWATDIQLRKAALLVRDIALRYGIHDASPAQVIHNLVGVNAPYVEQGWEDAVPLSTGTAAQVDGIAPAHSGVLRHGQVFNRTPGRTDPQNFNLYAFMTRANQGIGFTLNSPANLLITDPLGRRVGVDPTTGQTVNEIPGASFSGAGVEPQTIAVPGGIDGQYQVQVVGTGDGMFHLDMYAASRGGDLMRTQVADQTSAGATASYTLHYTTQIDAHATVTGAANLPPVAFADQYLTRGSSPVGMNVLGNDSDPEGLLDVTSLAIVLAPANGVTSLDPVTGLVAYTPTAGFVGDDSFQYVVRDTAGLESATATVTVRVLRETQAPSAGDDSAGTAFETPVDIDVLANDSDSDGRLDPTTVALDHNGDAGNGNVQIDPASGRITYPPNPGFIGEDTFSYAVLDNDLANSNLATVRVIVSGPTTQEVEVTGNGDNIVSGDSTPDMVDHTDFGLIGQNLSGPTRVFTVRNIGVANLTLDPVSLPPGFTLVEPLASSLAPGESDTFSVQLSTATLGIVGGLVSFANNDPNEDPFQFSIQGSVAISAGNLDLTFGGGDGRVVGNNGQAFSVVVQPDNKILVGGTNSRIYFGFLLERYNEDGSTDTTFGGGDGWVETGLGTNIILQGKRVLLLDDGKIMLVGNRSELAGSRIQLARYNSDGSLDTTFGGGGLAARFLGVNFVEDAAVQPDGKIVVIGSIDGHGRDFAVARFNANGTPDTTFGGGDGLVTTDLSPGNEFSNDVARSLVLQPDGKIVVGGLGPVGFGASTSDAFALVRYQANGELDTSFDGDGIVLQDFISPITNSGIAEDIALQSDGKIIVVGAVIARFNSDGSLDTTFGGDGWAEIDRGSPFLGDDPGRAVMVQPNGKIAVAGSFDTDFHVLRYNPDGTIDTGFDGDGRTTTDFAGHDDRVNDVLLQPDGKILAAGWVRDFSANLHFSLARYNGDLTDLPTVTLTATDAEGSETGPDGLRFTVARSGPTTEPLTIRLALQNDGGAGQATLGTDFTIDPATLQVTIPSGSSTADITVAVLADAVDEEDELLTPAILFSPEYHIGLPFVADGFIRGECGAVLNVGDLDPTFGGGDGLVDVGFERDALFTHSVALQPDGKLLVAGPYGGSFGQVGVARYKINGEPDTSFSQAGLVFAPGLNLGQLRVRIAIQADGKVLVAANAGEDFGLARLNANGTPDISFGGGDGFATADLGGFEYFRGMAVQADGKIVLAGGGGGDFALARFNTDGTLDTTFDSDGILTTSLGDLDEEVADLAIQPDGKIVVVGFVQTRQRAIGIGGDPGDADFALARYNPDGSLDVTFGAGDGLVTTSPGTYDKAVAVALQSDGKILVTGFTNGTRAEADSGYGGGAGGELALARYNSDGTLDGSFGGGDGLADPIAAAEATIGSDVLLAPDGKILVVGSDDGRLFVARYNVNGDPDTTFGGGDGYFGKGANEISSGSQIVDLALQPDGKIVATVDTSGLNRDGFWMARFTGPCISDSAASCDLETTVTSGIANSAVAGSNVSYAINVTNSGAAATDVVLTSELPANTTFVSFVAPAGWTTTTPALGGTGAVTATIPSLAGGETASFTLIVHVNASTPDGSILANTASTTTTSPDADPANNSDTETTAVIAVADLSITQSGSPDPVAAGQNLTYIIAVTNRGSSDAQGVALNDVIPTNTTFVALTAPAGWVSTTPAVGGTGPVTSTRATLAAGASASFTLVVRTAPTASDGTVITNTASLTTTTTDTDETDNTATATADVTQGILKECEVVTLNVAGAAGTATLRNDADHPGSGVIIVTGTSRHDVIIIEPHPGNASQVRVLINGRQADAFNISSFARFVAFGQAGHDTIIVAWNLERDAKLIGGSGNDSLFGGAGKDGLEGGVGNDHLFGGWDEDSLCGGAGNDFLFGQWNNDVLGGESGNDQLFGDSGDDQLQGGVGHDYLYGGSGNDRLFGQVGNDILFGDSGNDVVVGGAGNDHLYGGVGRDLLIGSTGDDTLFGEGDDDILIANATIHDNNELALMAILLEWTSSNSYTQRVNKLRFGGGANGAFKLDNTTVLDDGRPDILWGHGGMDWFLTAVNDRIRDKAANDQEK
ncbi:MAG TPA: Ig-like domain-containing protein [Planctomycetaceae bacterium]|nr:Ig-like domain-containing protein [Planctomycetaceae bacterium]